MIKSCTSLSKNDVKFLLSLLDNGSKNDTEIANDINMSKATVSRIRKRLEENFISDYIPIINLEKVGVNIFLVALFQWKSYKDDALTKKFIAELEKDPHVIFLADGEGNDGLTTSVFFGFEDINEYQEYFKEFRKKYEDQIGKVVTLITSSQQIIKHDFTDIIKHQLRRCVK